MKAIAVKMEEYKAIRAEILASISAQQSILRFGSAIVLAMVVFVIRDLGSLRNPTEVSWFVSLVLLVVVPLSCYTTVIIWLGEIWRMMRAGEYLEIFEREMNDSDFQNQNVLNWENWRRSTGNTKVHFLLRGNYWGTAVLFYGGSLLSIILGTYLLFKIDETTIAFAACAANSGLLLLMILLTHSATRRFR